MTKSRKSRANSLIEYMDSTEEERLLKPSGVYCVAVADNVLRKVQVPTHAILMGIAQEVGFRVIDHYASVVMMRPHNMRETEKIKAEWVMTFRKEG